MKEQWVVEAEQNAKDLAERINEQIAGEADYDYISREAAIRLVEQYPNIIVNRRSGLIADIKHLPSVTLAEKTGHWIDTGSGQMCNRYGEIQYGYDSFRYFCAYCGAKMVEPQESEE